MPATAKICGLTTPEAVTAALDGGASHLGFVFFPRSPRHLTPDRAAELAALEGSILSHLLSADDRS